MKSATKFTALFILSVTLLSAICFAMPISAKSGDTVSPMWNNTGLVTADLLSADGSPIARVLVDAVSGSTIKEKLEVVRLIGTRESTSYGPWTYTTGNDYLLVNQKFDGIVGATYKFYIDLWVTLNGSTEYIGLAYYSNTEELTQIA